MRALLSIARRTSCDGEFRSGPEGPRIRRCYSGAWRPLLPPVVAAGWVRGFPGLKCETWAPGNDCLLERDSRDSPGPNAECHLNVGNYWFGAAHSRFEFPFLQCSQCGLVNNISAAANKLSIANSAIGKNGQRYGRLARITGWSFHARLWRRDRGEAL